MCNVKGVKGEEHQLPYCSSSSLLEKEREFLKSKFTHQKAQGMLLRSSGKDVLLL